VLFRSRLELGGSSRDYYDGYVDQVILRDLAELDVSRDPVRLRRFLQSYALNSAGVTTLKAIYDVAGVDQRTARAYEGLLADMFLIDDLPAYWSNRLKRLVKMPKRLVTEPGLLAPLWQVDRAGILASGDLTGRMLETFVAAQLRVDAELSSVRARLLHLRDQSGTREVDLVVEFADGRVLGIEVKATSTPSRHDARHLAWLRDQVGDQFVAGIVLHAGPSVSALDDRIVAAPISVLWS
jgi:predicted AAA+ superfamily ATPase